jgi:phosphoribosylformylglycinamidine synthase
VASKRWVYRQYDHMVRTNSIVLAGMGAGVVRIKGTNRALAMSTDGNGRYCYLNPRRGAMLALAEAARNVACAGALPIGGTNCLNFGNPERPEIMWQFVEAVEGLADACRALEVPITGGNVSLYNETDGQAIFPTPVIGVVGLIEDATRVVSRTFKKAGDEIVLLGDGYGELGGSEYLKTMLGLVQGQPPELDLAKERSLIVLLNRAASAGLLQSAHDCSDGGVAITLAECAFDTGGVGFAVDLPLSTSPVATLFGESASRAIVSVATSNLQTLLQLAASLGVPARSIGRTGGSNITMAIAGSPSIECPVADAEEVWAHALGRYFARRAA